MIENILINGKISAVVYRKNFEIKNGINFHTENKETLQIGAMNWNKGHQISPHYHKKQSRLIDTTQEILFIRSGVVECIIHDLKRLFIKRTLLYEGDIIHLITNCHQFKIIENAQIIEIKQGPYNKIDDKILI